MSAFRTTLPPFQPDMRIEHQQKIACFGSCFAEHMASKFQNTKFDCILNPFGIQYNPHNIAQSIDMILEDYVFTDIDLVQRDGRWFSLWHHSTHSATSPNALKEQLRAAAQDAKLKIQQTDVFVFTFGTAFYYLHKATDIVAANCHKLSKELFDKKRLAPEEIAASFTNTLHKLLITNPKAKFIFTVSPIRHAKDGLIENTRSKAILHLSIDALLKHFPQAVYFPSYEIMLDDLRDYRFYTSDMLHPSTTAVEYIWEHFTKHLFSEETQQINKQIEAIQLAVQHRPFHIDSEAHQKFIHQTLHKIDLLNADYHTLDFSKEREKLKEQLS